MKYVSLDNLKQYDKLLKDYIVNKTENIEDILSYGVLIDSTIADPHLTRVGNLTLHKTLPVQSQLKGCIAQGNVIQYWLNENDWRFRKDPITQAVKLIVTSITTGEGDSAVTTTTYTITADVFNTLQYEGAYIKYNDLIAQITSIDTTNKVATITFTDTEGLPTESADSVNIELGSVRNGYDGNVCIYIPTFYIKGFTLSDTQTEVRITTVKIDDTWEEQKEGLLAAYRGSVLNTVPENMGYLSTLPVNSAVSIVNEHTYCRGGSNDTTYDSYLTTDKLKTSLNKPRTNITRANMRTYCRNSGGQMLSYNQYKNILYWLWVIEYANFNSQEAYTSELTSGGYHQGGMGNGLSQWDWQTWNVYNKMCPLTPNGFMDELGNKTGIKTITLPEVVVSDTKTVKSITQNIPRWRGITNPFGDIYTNVDGIILDTPTAAAQDSSILPTAYIITDPTKYTDKLDEAKNNSDRYIQFAHDYGYITAWKLGKNADIVPVKTKGTSTTYICDFLSVGYGGTPNTMYLGGCAAHQSFAGLGYWIALSPVSNAASFIGFRPFFGSVSFK